MSSHLVVNYLEYAIFLWAVTLAGITNPSTQHPHRMFPTTLIPGKERMRAVMGFANNDMTAYGDDVHDSLGPS